MSDNEKILCGQMLIDNSIIPNVYDTIKPNCFATETYKKIYKKIYELYLSGLSPDILTLSREIENCNPLTIAELTQEIGSAANWSYYANEIKNNYIKKGILDVIVTADELLKEKKETGQDIINNVLSGLSELTSNTSSCTVYSMADLINKEVKIIENYINNKSEYLGYKTGFENIDKIINGLQSVYMVIGARPSMGKTALAQKMAMNLSKEVKVLFIELEMSMQQLTERAISNLSKIPYRAIQSGMISQEKMKIMYNKMSQLYESQNFIPAECRTRRLDDIVNLCRAQVRNNGVKVIFIDHIGLIRVDGKMQAWEKTREISNTLQKLRIELGIPIVALSQLDRASEGNKEPDLNSFRGSGAIEEDADICCIIGRERATDEKTTDIPTNFWIKKNRNGQVGNAKLIFKPEIVDFIDGK